MKELPKTKKTPHFKIISVTFCVLFISGAVLYFGQEMNLDEKTYIKPSLQQRIIGKFEHERAKVIDPKTGDIPSERLIDAHEIILKKLQQKDAIPGINWEERGPSNVSGRTRSIMIDARDNSGNTLWAGGVSGGLWKSTNGGISWVIINEFFNNMAVTSIVQDPNDLNTLYFGTGENWAFGSGLRGNGIYKSTNGGTSFTPMTFTVNNKDFEFINRLAIQSYNGSTVLYAATSSSDNNKGGLFITQNGGTSWLVWKGNNTGVNNFASDVKITVPDPGNGGNSVVIAAFGGAGNGPDGPIDNESDGIYVSLNGGSSWFQEYTSHPNEGRIELAVSPTDPYIRYMICESKDAMLLPSIYGRIFNGTFYSYVPISPPIQGWKDLDCNNPSLDIFRGQDFYDLAIAVSPANPYRLMIGGVDLWLYERDPNTLNEVWAQITHWAGLCGFQKVHADQHVILYKNANEVYVGNDGGVWKTDNANSNLPSFGFRGNSLNITQYYSADIHPTAGVHQYLAGAQDNGTQLYTTPGVNNTDEVTGGDGAFSHIDQNNPLIQISAFTNQTYSVTLDGWQTKKQGIKTTGGRFINPTDYDDSTKKLYCTNGSGTYTRWEDPSTAGSTLTTVTVGSFPTNIQDPRAWSVRVSPNIANRVYFGFDNGVVIKVDGANTGTSKAGQQIFNLNLGKHHAVSCIEIEEGNENHVIITLSNYGITSIYESINANTANPTWTAIEGNLPDLPVRWAMFNPKNSDQLFIATELGVWSTTNINGSGTDWDPTNAGLSNTRIDMIKYRKSDLQVVVATHGRGLYTTDDLGVTCETSHTLSNQTLSGNYKASQFITSTNNTVNTSLNLSAPIININKPLTVNSGALLTINSENCN